MLGLRSTSTPTGDKLFIFKYSASTSSYTFDELILAKTQFAVLDHSYSALRGKIAIDTSNLYLSIFSDSQIQTYNLAASVDPNMCSSASVGSPYTNEITMTAGPTGTVSGSQSAPFTFSNPSSMTYSVTNSMISPSALTGASASTNFEL